MPRPVTLFTGQWADLTFDTLCAKASSFGYDGVEIACWGDHMDVEKALSNDAYLRSRKDILEKHGLKCFAISNHLAGQAVCDRIDERHKSVVPERVWGDGKEDGVRSRAVEEMKMTARAAATVSYTHSALWVQCSIQFSGAVAMHSLTEHTSTTSGAEIQSGLGVTRLGK